MKFILLTLEKLKEVLEIKGLKCRLNVGCRVIATVVREKRETPKEKKKKEEKSVYRR